MPQLDSSVYITQIFWLLITFISFWFIMDKILVPKISEKIEERKRKYNDYIQKAEEINEKALNTLQKYKEKMAEAMTNATTQINANEKELETFVCEKQNELSIKLKQQIEENEKKIAIEMKDSLAKIDDMANSVALAIAAGLNLDSLSKGNVKNIIEKAGTK